MGTGQGHHVNAGVVTVRKRQWLSWLSVTVSKIPNFFVFYALVNAIQSSKHNSYSLSAS